MSASFRLMSSPRTLDGTCAKRCEMLCRHCGQNTANIVSSSLALQAAWQLSSWTAAQTELKMTRNQDRSRIQRYTQARRALRSRCPGRTRCAPPAAPHSLAPPTWPRLLHLSTDENGVSTMLSDHEFEQMSAHLHLVHASNQVKPGLGSVSSVFGSVMHVLAICRQG